VTMFARHWSVVASLEEVEVPGRVLYVAPASVMSGVSSFGGTAFQASVMGLQSAQSHELAGEQPDAWWQRDAWRQREACGRRWWWAERRVAWAKEGGAPASPR
jgi:hypothetical protein